jgi:anthranilate synthase component 2
MQHILVIDNHDSFVYNLVQLLRQNGRCRFEIISNDRIAHCHPRRFDKILLSPGPGIPEEAGDMPALIDQCKHTHPILGICLGHQAIAENFGASLQQLTSPRHGHSSPLNITDPGDPLFRQIPPGTPIGRYHSWVIDPAGLPACLKISSLDEEGHIMSFYHASLPIHGLQFHPESIITRHGRQIINNWLDE